MVYNENRILVHGFLLAGRLESLSKNMLVLFLVAVLLILSLTILWQKRSHGNPEPPYISGYIPLIGHAYRLIGNSEHIFELIQEITEQAIRAGDTVRFGLGPVSCYVLADPDDAMTVATTCMKKSFLYNFSRKWIGDGLISCMDVTKWRAHRKLLNHAFNQQVLDGFLPIFNNNARRMVDQFAIEGKNGPFCPDKITMQCSLETIYQTATGLDLSADKEANENFVASTDEIFLTIIKRVQNIFYYNNLIWNCSSLKTRQDEAIKFAHSIVNKIVEIRKQKLKELTQESITPGTKPKSFSDLFFDIHDIQAKGKFTENDVLDHVNTLIVGGYDTVATTFLIVMLVIGSDLEIQKKIYAELEEVFDKTDRDVERQDLSRLVYTEAVIKEVLRLYPVGPFVIRHIDKEVRLKNYTLKPGRNCFLLLNAINRHPKWWDDPEELKPERWLNLDTLPRNPYMFSSFSFGRRNCIGRTYAIMWMKTFLSHILRKYHISSDITKLVLKYDVLTKVSSGHYISIKSRQCLD